MYSPFGSSKPATNFPPVIQILLALKVISFPEKNSSSANLKVPSIITSLKVNSSTLKMMVHSQGTLKSQPYLGAP